MDGSEDVGIMYGYELRMEQINERYEELKTHDNREYTTRVQSKQNTFFAQLETLLKDHELIIADLVKEKTTW